MLSHKQSFTLSRIIFIFLIFASVFYGNGLQKAAAKNTQINHPKNMPFKISPVFSKENPCIAGSGWTWASGADRPDIAVEAKNGLTAAGINGNISAREFGEVDSCGNFEFQSVDFNIEINNTDYGEVTAQEDTNTIIIQELGKLNIPDIGNIEITNSSGDSVILHTADEKNLALTSDIYASTTPSFGKKIYLLVYDPTLSGGAKFSTYMGWTSYDILVQGIISSFQTASHGELQYTIPYTTVLNEWPLKLDGFRYTESQYISDYQNKTPHANYPDADYDAIISDPRFGICEKLNSGEIDEVWIYGGAYDGFYESRFVGPNGYWLNSPPMEATHNCNRLLPIMGLNFERGLAEAMHSFGHRAESVLMKTYGSWNQNQTSHNWNKFALVKSLSPNYAYSGCGDVHYPPNGLTDYDYDRSGNATPTNCGDFDNYPNLNNNPLSVAQSVTCTAWNCNHYEYLMYWFSHLPHNSGCGTDQKTSNWWEYFANSDLPLNASSPCASSTICPTITAWKGEYWSNASLSGSPVICRDDLILNLEWNLGSPDPLIPDDNFSARWTRSINFENGLYLFRIRHDNGARIYIDNTLFGDFWGTCCDWDYAETPITKGIHTIRLEYFEIDGAAHAELWWENLNQQNIFTSIGTQDGDILESSETSKKGGTKNNTASTIRLGDDAAKKQYLSILSFNTSLPAGAQITNVTLKVKKAGVVGGGNPVNTFGGFIAQVKKPSFGTLALAAGDFQAKPGASTPAVKAPLVGGWYTLDLTSVKAQVNTAGNTQIRLKFKLDDNNNLVANYLKLYSGNSTSANRPQLILEYYVP